jgi:hypothetical protein
MRLAGAIFLLLALFVATKANATPLALTCLTESGEPCPIDERPPVSGREAERNWRRLQREQRLPDGARAFDMRNGRFVVITRPSFHDVSPGYCTVRIEDNFATRPFEFVHAEMSREECEREQRVFAQGGMQWPLNGLRSIRCETQDAYWCFSALARFREAVARIERDSNARVAGFQRDRDYNIATARTLASASRPFVYAPLDGGRWGCSRIGMSGAGFGDTEALACTDATENGEPSTTIYVSGPYQQ